MCGVPSIAGDAPDFPVAGARLAEGTRIMSRFVLACFTVAIAWMAGCSSAAHPTGGGRTGTPLPQPAPPPDHDFDSIAVPPSACVAGWQISLVSHQGSDPQFAVAPDGTMHMMYIGFGNGQTALRHVAEDRPTLADTVSPSGLGSLAIAPDGTPVAFVGARAGTVQAPNAVGILLVADGKNGWHIDPQPISDDGGVVNASAIDPQGHAHVAFGDGGLFYVSDDGSGWTRTQVGDAMQVDVFDLQLDAHGNAHVWFNAIDPITSQPANFWSTNAGNASGSWKTTLVPATDVSPAIDSQGRPHVVTGGAGGVSHLWYDGTAWQTQTLPIGNVTVYDMRLDAQDQPELVVGTRAADLSLAHEVAGSWRVEHVMTFDSAGEVPKARLGFDGAGNPHIGFKGDEAGATFGFARRCD
jgi:hypothetical protein